MAKRTDTETKVNSSRTRFVLAHGEKGGVGKSMTACVLADSLNAAGVPVAIIDADPRNPDVIRMFERVEEIPQIALNLRATDGWMDAMDFVHQHPGYTFVLSLPAGIGETMQQEFTAFVRFLKAFNNSGLSTELILMWVINLFADSVNLLDSALKTHGGQFDQVIVVRNQAFGEPGKFILWDESPLKETLEQQGGITVDLPPLHLRVTQKLLNPNTIMPFSMAIDPDMATSIGFTPSEQFVLSNWIKADVPKGLGAALERVGVAAQAAS